MASRKEESGGLKGGRGQLCVVVGGTLFLRKTTLARKIVIVYFFIQVKLTFLNYLSQNSQDFHEPTRHIATILVYWCTINLNQIIILFSQFATSFLQPIPIPMHPIPILLYLLWGYSKLSKKNPKNRFSLCNKSQHCAHIIYRVKTLLKKTC